MLIKNGETKERPKHQMLKENSFKTHDAHYAKGPSKTTLYIKRKLGVLQWNPNTLSYFRRLLLKYVQFKQLFIANK